LVPVCSQPLLKHLIDKLKGAGYSEAVINIHHFAEKIKDYVAQNGNFGMDISFSDETDMLRETGGGIRHAAKLLDDGEPFLVHNVDILSNADLQWLQSEVRSEALATLLVSERETTRYLLFAPDTMRLVGWHNTDSGAYHLADESIALEDCRALGFSGIHILSDRVLGLMEEYARSRDLPVEDPAGVKFSIMNFYLWAASAYPIYGVVAKDLEFLDVGKLDALAPAEEFVRR
jgi:NDP-sugar pyrophosphorylase family protein